MTTSVFIPSARRPQHLSRCLESLLEQSVPAHEVIVVWQGEDEATMEVAARFQSRFGNRLKVIHLDQTGIVPAENAALRHSTGEIVFLIDDDAAAPPDWISGHLQHYADPQVGAVGGWSRNFRADGSPQPRQPRRPQGRLTATGRLLGNLFDLPDAWRTRGAVPVDHLIGVNMSIRRDAFDGFEEALKPYWQCFELDVCCQVRKRGYKVLFDYDSVVDHYPSNPVFNSSHSDPVKRQLNPSWNQAFILGRYSPWHLRFIRLLFLVVAGTNVAPGPVLFLLQVLRRRRACDAPLIAKLIRHRIDGWRKGAALRNPLQHPLPADTAATADRVL